MSGGGGGGEAVVLEVRARRQHYYFWNFFINSYRRRGRYWKYFWSRRCRWNCKCNCKFYCSSNSCHSGGTGGAQPTQKLLGTMVWAAPAATLLLAVLLALLQQLHQLGQLVGLLILEAVAPAYCFRHFYRFWRRRRRRRWWISQGAHYSTAGQTFSYSVAIGGPAEPAEQKMAAAVDPV